MSDFDEIFSSVENNYQIFDVTTRGTTIYVSGRYDSAKNFDIVLNDFRPYMYVPLESKSLHYFKPFVPEYDCEKIYFEHPKQLRDEREKVKFTYEADLKYDIRFHTDMMIKYKSSSNILPRYWLYDIEVFSNFKAGMPKPEDIDRPVNAITFYDSYSRKYYTIVVLHKEFHKNISKGILNINNRVIIKVGDEYELFVHFIHLMKKMNPNCLSGWNSIGFDDPYVCKRLKNFYPDLFNQLSPFAIEPYFQFREKDNVEEWTVPGIVFLDYMLLYKKYNQNKRESYGLDFIAKVELKEEEGGKLKYEGTLDELYAYDFDTFLDYNIRDVELLVKLDEKLMFILLVNEMKEISSSPMRYFNFQNTTKFVDSLICRYIRNKEIPFVMRTRPNVMHGGKFSGANVRNPLIGFHDWIIDLDASSMYPSIIRSLNISPETWFCKIVIDRELLNKYVRPYITNNVLEYPNNLSMVNVIYMDGTQKVEKIIDLKNNLIQASGGLGNYTVASNGSIFLNNGWGIIPEIQQDLVDNRTKYKDLKKIWGYVEGYIKTESDARVNNVLQ